MDKKEINREEIIAEYLTGNISYRALGEKYGVPSRSICDWVMRYQGRLLSWQQGEYDSMRMPVAVQYPNESGFSFSVLVSSSDAISTWLSS